jgi:hypothetical protein
MRAAAAAFALLWALAPGVSGGTDGLRGESTAEGGRVHIEWSDGAPPRGSVHPAQEPSGVPGAKPPARAWTQGVFTLRYTLARDGDAVRPRELSVTASSRVHYPADRTPRLEEHEETHRRINAAAAVQMEKTLSAFSARAAEGDGGLRRAESLLKRDFRRLVAETDGLHRDWDATHTVPR